MNESVKIINFTDLNTWKEGHKLVLMVYRVTRNFPQNEMFGLVSQINRAVVSITSNIAEGFSRASRLEKKQFYYTSLSSLTETQNQIIIARDLDYISSKDFEMIFLQSVAVQKLINGLLKSAMGLVK